MKKENDEINYADENEFRELFSKDPVPELKDIEVERLVSDVLSKTGVKKELKWFEIRPIYQFGLAAAALLLFYLGIAEFKGNGAARIPVQQTSATQHLSEETEEMVISAIEKGKLDEGAINSLMKIDADTKNIIEELYPQSLDDKIENLTDEKAEKILNRLEELGYKEEV